MCQEFGVRATLLDNFSLTQQFGADASQSLSLSMLDRTQSQAASTLLFDVRPTGAARGMSRTT